jgi:hypothetical protein
LFQILPGAYVSMSVDQTRQKSLATTLNYVDSLRRTQSWANGVYPSVPDQNRRSGNSALAIKDPHVLDQKILSARKR